MGGRDGGRQGRGNGRRGKGGKEHPLSSTEISHIKEKYTLTIKRNAYPISLTFSKECFLLTQTKAFFSFHLDMIICPLFQSAAVMYVLGKGSTSSL